MRLQLPRGGAHQVTCCQVDDDDDESRAVIAAQRRREAQRGHCGGDGADSCCVSGGVGRSGGDVIIGHGQRQATLPVVAAAMCRASGSARVPYVYLRYAELQ